MNKTDVYTAPIRLCYHRLCHYNSLVDPYKPTIGVGLGLPGFNPGSADRSQVKQAVKNSEEDLVEKTMLEDKIRATDWEATNEAIEEQVARESYLQWLRDNERRVVAPPPGNSKSATVTSADLKIQASQASGTDDEVITIDDQDDLFFLNRFWSAEVLPSLPRFEVPNRLTFSFGLQHRKYHYHLLV